MPDKIRVMVAGEQGLWREGLHSLLKAHEDIQVIGEAADGKQAIEQACELHPDVVVMDTSLKIFNGLEATRRLTQQVPDARVIILADRNTKDNVIGAFVAGARGCMPKNTTGADLAFAVNAVYRGEIYLHPMLTETLVKTYLLFKKIADAEDPYEQLTERERQVVRLVAEGRTSPEIAGELGITVKSVRGHTAWAMKKLNFHRRSELIRYAIRRGIVDSEAEG